MSPWSSVIKREHWKGVVLALKCFLFYSRTAFTCNVNTDTPYFPMCDNPGKL